VKKSNCSAKVYFSLEPNLFGSEDISIVTFVLQCIRSSNELLDSLTEEQRSCPKSNDYLGIVVPERKAKVPVQAINGRCLKCGYRLA
jgi:hypothetical protein